MHSAHFQIRILFFLAALLGLGLIPQLNIQLNPSPQTQDMSITFRYPGMGPELIEREVTSIIESSLSRLDQLESIESTSREGTGNIELRFDKEARMEDIRLLVSTLIRQIYATLPEGVSYPAIRYDSEFESYPTLMVYAAVSDLESETFQKVIDKEVILPLSAIPGIHDIELTGIPSWEYHVKVEEEKLRRYGISYQDIRRTINDWSQQQNLGLIAEPKNQQLISVQYSADHSQASSLFTLPALPLKKVHNRILYLKEVATIEQKTSAPSFRYRINGKNSVRLIIKADPSVNQIALARNIRQRISAQQQKLAKQLGLVLETDHSEFLKKELNTIFKRMAAAMGILFLFMVLIYRNFRKLWAIFYSFMISLSLSGLVYYFADIELHLYSLAGFTLSLGIVLDNLIISAEHLRFHQDQRIFLALLAATLTTAGALSIIFFISPEYREQLTDFAWIFFINLGMSLIVALFLMPAIVKNTRQKYRFRRRTLVHFNRAFARYTRWSARRRWVPLIILLLCFGLPLFLLPQQWEAKGKIPTLYNKIMEGYYGRDVHPILSKYLGGTLQLFAKSKDRFFFGQQQQQETRLFVRAKMPFGGTTEQLDAIIKDFESFLSQFPEIRQFHSRVSSPSNSRIEISFQEAYADGSFPYQLKALLEHKATQSGSGDFQVYGVGQGFNNEIRGGSLTTHLRLLGYNYDQLWALAEHARTQLLQHLRIQKVFINPNKNYFEPTAEFFQLELDDGLFAADSTFSLQDLVNSWKQIEPDQDIIGYTPKDNLPIRLVSDNSDKNQLWFIRQDLQPLDSNRYFKNVLYSRLEKRKGSVDVVRYNQQYQLYLEYDFIGNQRLAQKVKEKAIEEIAAQLPPGYQISDDKSQWWWKESTDELTYIVMASLVLIFLIAAILFNSLKQAFIPLILIPPAFIGIFLATHFIEFRFDQGGFAALLLVAGLSVNAGIFIVNDYNNIKKRRPKLSPASIFIKAYNAKIIPIFLTALSTVLGLLPFLLFERNEPFWYALAICTITGITFSLLGILLLLPLFWPEG